MKKMLLILICLFAQYARAQDSMDVAYVRTKDNQWQLISRQGITLLDSLFEHPERALLQCSEGMVVTEKSGKYGFVNLFTHAHLAEAYDSVGMFRNGRTAVRKDGRWHLLTSIGVPGKSISDKEAALYLTPLDIPACKDDYCLVETDTFINCKGPDGKLLLAKSDVFIAPWNDVNSFINDRILKYKVMANKVCSCHKMTSYYGFINRNDQWVIEPEYEQADIFAYGLAAVGVGFEEIYTYGYIGHNGIWIIKPVYKEAGRFFRTGIR